MSLTIFDDFDALMIALSSGDEAKVWKHFISIQTDLAFDENITPSEKDCLDHLNAHLFEAINLKSAMSVGPKLRALRASLENRISGHRYA